MGKLDLVSHLPLGETLLRFSPRRECLAICLLDYSTCCFMPLPCSIPSLTLPKKWTSQQALCPGRSHWGTHHYLEKQNPLGKRCWPHSVYLCTGPRQTHYLPLKQALKPPPLQHFSACQGELVKSRLPLISSHILIMYIVVISHKYASPRLGIPGKAS